MTIEIIIQVPRSLGEQLNRVQDRLPEILDRGLREILAEQQSKYQDENKIMEMLVSNPTPEQVLGLRPAPDVQARVSELLARLKTVKLSSSEEAELERYLLLEHLVRLAKAHAYKKLTH